MQVANLRQRTPPWHDWRNDGITASEIGAVLGLCPYRTSYRLWAEKKGLILPANLDRNPNVRRGVTLEPKARQSFESRHDVMLMPLCAANDQYPFIKASFDGVDEHGIPVEIKAPSIARFQEAVDAGGELTSDDYYEAKASLKSSKVYNLYYPQLQQQILVAGSDHAWLTLYLNDNEYLDIPIQRDQAFIDTLIIKATEFYQLLKKNQPPVRDPERDIFIPTGMQLDTWNSLALQYHQTEEQIQLLKKTLEALTTSQTDLEKQFISLMGDFLQAESAGLRVNRYFQQGAIDYKAVLKQHNPDLTSENLDAFRKAGSERCRITTKNEAAASVPYKMDDIVIHASNTDFWFF